MNEESVIIMMLILLYCIIIRAYIGRSYEVSLSTMYGKLVLLHMYI